MTNVEGIVTVKRDTKYNKGFFIQSFKNDKDMNTSEGIYIENKTDEGREDR